MGRRDVLGCVAIRAVDRELCVESWVCVPMRERPGRLFGGRENVSFPSLERSQRRTHTCTELCCKAQVATSIAGRAARSHRGGCVYVTARGVSRVCLLSETVAGGPALMQGDAYIRCVCCGSERARDEEVLCELGGGRLDSADVALFAKDGGFGRERRFWCALM